MTGNQLYNSEFYEGQQEGSFRSAEVIIGVLLRLISFRSVVDVGCGIGTWLRAVAMRGVSDFLGVDGEYVDRAKLQIREDQFVSRDVGLALTLDRRFDLAISLEVAEHLPAESAATLILSLVKLAPIVLFSAAIPFQGGTGHVNEQWPDYWTSLFRNHGYVPVDCIRPYVWDDPRVEWWYAQNILVYASPEGLSKNPALAEVERRKTLSQLSVVHPKNYLRLAHPPPPGFRRSLALTAASAKNAFRKRLRGLPGFRGGA